MKPLRTARLILRNWEEGDRPLFHRINSDPRVMEFFPFRRDRAASDAMMNRLRAGIRANGFGFAAVEIASSGETIGFAGLHADEPVTAGAQETEEIEVGWRLAPEFWGKGYAAEAAAAWLAHGFETLDLPVIWSFAVWNNRRSTAVMERLGMEREASRDFDHPRIPDTHPHLKRHVVYRLTRERWLERMAHG